MAPFALDVAPPGEEWRRVRPSLEDDIVREMLSALLNDSQAIHAIASGREVNVAENPPLDCSDDGEPALIGGPLPVDDDLRIWRFRLAALPLFG